MIAVLALAIAAIVLGAFFLFRARHSTPPKPDKPDTTLGEFRDMREALRPLEHGRAASRRDPGNETSPSRD